jgi:hypothetical protein
MGSRSTLIGLLMALILGVPSQALGSWVVDGHGFGHGVGMSQYGAYGYAKHGAGYKQILGIRRWGGRRGQRRGRRPVARQG